MHPTRIFTGILDVHWISVRSTIPFWEPDKNSRLFYFALSQRTAVTNQKHTTNPSNHNDTMESTNTENSITGFTGYTVVTDLDQARDIMCFALSTFFDNKNKYKYGKEYVKYTAWNKKNTHPSHKSVYNFIKHSTPLSEPQKNILFTLTNKQIFYRFNRTRTTKTYFKRWNRSHNPTLLVPPNRKQLTLTQKIALKHR